MPSPEYTNGRKPAGPVVFTPFFESACAPFSGARETLPRTESEIRRERIWNNLGVLYPDKTFTERAAIQREIYKTIVTRRAQYEKAEFPKHPVGFTEEDANITVYPDSVFRKRSNQTGYDGATMDAYEDLFTGKDLNKGVVRLSSVFNGVQLLPHQVASDLDRGFSQIDPYEVDPKFGSWENVKRLARQGVRVTVDQLVNHASISGKWFQKGEIEGDPEYQGIFESYPEDDPPHEDFIDNFSPREHETWIKRKTSRGLRWFRHTFGDKGTTDQADFTYQNWKTLVKQVDLALFNVVNGAEGIRMDSVAFTSKKRGKGNRGVHEPEVSNILQIIRDAVDEVEPTVRLLSENNVPQKQNIESLGRPDFPLSHEIYDFGLSAIMLRDLYSEQADNITDWMLKQPTLPAGTTKINHVSCHDGVFLQEAYSYFKDRDLERGIPEDVAGMADMHALFKGVKTRGGELAMRKSPRGEGAVYELDGTWRSLISKEDEDPDIARKKHILTYAVASAIQGMPSIFLPSLLGKRNDKEKFAETGMPRDLLRVDMDYDELVSALNDTDSEERKTYDAMMAMLKIRTSKAAFRPDAPQEILTANDAVERVNGRIDNSKKRVFGVRRMSDEGDMVALHNFSSNTVEVTYDEVTYTLGPYKYRWEEVPARSGIGTVIDLFQAEQQSIFVAA